MIALLTVFGLTITASWLGSYITLALSAAALWVLVRGAGLKWLDRSLSEIQENQKIIKKELEPNSGSSIKDQMNRIEGLVQTIQAEQVAVKDRLETLEASRPFWRR